MKINYVDDIKIEISQELQKAFEKASHNRFIQPFLTQDNKVGDENFKFENIPSEILIKTQRKIKKEG